jgi:hypothetical protein
VADTPNTPVAMPDLKAPGVALLNKFTSADARVPLVLPKFAFAPPPAFTKVYVPIGAPLEVTLVVVELAVTDWSFLPQDDIRISSIKFFSIYMF